jgi:hypothetical protein
LGLLAIGIFSAIIGVRLRDNETIQLLDGDVAALWSGIGLTILMGIFFICSVGLIIRPNRCFSVFYGILMFITFLIFIGAAVVLLVGRGAIKREILKQCNDPNSSIHEVDLMYALSDFEICSKDCPCAADRNLWADPTKSKMVTNLTSGVTQIQ